MTPPYLILSSRSSFNRYRECIDYALKNDYQGVEWYLDYYRIPAGKQSRAKFFDALRESGLVHGFHGPVNDADIAQRDASHSGAACAYHMMDLDFHSELAPLTYTVHIGGRRIAAEELSRRHAADNLAKLCAHARSKGITLCLENLTRGWTGDPVTLLAMVETAEAAVTFDVGHARGGQWVREGQGSALDFLNIVAARVANAHIYECEDDAGRHVPPQNTAALAPLLERLATIGCRRWVLELDGYAATEATRRVVDEHINIQTNGDPA